MDVNPIKQVDQLVWGDAIEKHGLPGRIVATTLRYLYAVLRDFFSGQLTLRAMSLVYSTLLSIIPLLAFSFSLLKGFGVHETYEEQLYNFLAVFGEQGAEWTTQIITLVDNVNGRVLGSIGLAFFIYTAISMVQKVEESFNYVWYVTKRENFAQRFMEYVFVLLIPPIVMVMALGMLTSLQNEGIVQWLLHNQYVGPLFVQLGKLTPYAMIAGVFTFLYMFMPNTRVKFVAALVGGIAAGIMWATLSAAFAAFVVNSTMRLKVYAGFALPITALIWLYLNWLVLLIGAQLAFYFQNPAYLRIGRRDPRLSNSMRERLALNIMYLVGQAFRDSSRTIDLEGVADKLGIPPMAITPTARRLESAGLLNLTGKENLQPGRDINRIRLDDVLAVVRTEGQTGSYKEPQWTGIVDALGGELDAAVNNTVNNETLADLLDRGALET